MRSAFTAIALLIRSTLGAWRGYPQIVPPQDCTCDAALGQQLSDLRKKHAAAAARLPPMTIMTYGFPHSLALPTSNVVGAAEYRQATTTALISRHIASPATAASLSSLARVLRDVGPLQSSGRVMMCPPRQVPLEPLRHTIERSIRSRLCLAPQSSSHSMLATRCTWRKSGSRCLCSRQRT